MTVIDMGGRPLAERRGPTSSLRRGQKLYEVVMDLVDSLIVDHGLAPGDLLPTQGELAERAGVSLITVRRALDELERDGRVRRHQGVGTFVAHPKIVSEPTRAGGLGNTFSGAERGRLATNVLEVTRVRPTTGLAEALRCGTDVVLWRVRRQRLLGGQPIVLETALIPSALAPALDQRPSTRLGALYDLLAAEYGLVDDYEEQYLDVVTPSTEDRKLLRLTPRSQVVRIRGISVTADGTPFDAFEQVYPASNFVFAMSGTTSRQLLVGATSQTWDTRPAGR